MALSVSFSAVPWLLTEWLGWHEGVLIAMGSQVLIVVYYMSTFVKTKGTYEPDERATNCDNKAPVVQRMKCFIQRKKLLH